MSNYISLKIDLSSIYPVDPEIQEARVKSNLTANELIQEIINEFGSEAGSRPDNFRLLRTSGSKALGGRQTLQIQGVRDNETLTFISVSEAQRRNLEQVGSAYLLLMTQGDKFPIKWHPAIIGRPDYNNPIQNDLLAVNLGGYENSSKVSRQHAQIKVRKGRHYIQALSDRNPTILNGKRLELKKNYPLEDQDEIRLGFSQIKLKFILD